MCVNSYPYLKLKYTEMHLRYSTHLLHHLKYTKLSTFDPSHLTLYNKPQEELIKINITVNIMHGKVFFHFCSHQIHWDH